MNWFIPAFVKSSVGSSAGTSDELGTMVWPFCSKYSRKLRRISRERIRYCQICTLPRVACLVVSLLHGRAFRCVAQRAATTAAGVKPWRIRYWKSRA